MHTLLKIIVHKGVLLGCLISRSVALKSSLLCDEKGSRQALQRPQDQTFLILT